MIAKTASDAIAKNVPFVGYYPLVKDEVKRVVAENLRTLIEYDRRRGGPCYDAKRLAPRAGVAESTVGRILSARQAAAIDTLDAIAHAYHLRAWQLLIPRLDPTNPPVVMVSDAERNLWERLRSVAADLAQLGEVEGAADEGKGHRHDDHPPSAASRKRSKT